MDRYHKYRTKDLKKNQYLVVNEPLYIIDALGGGRDVECVGFTDEEYDENLRANYHMSELIRIH